MMSDVLKVSSSGYYNWKKNKESISNKHLELDKDIKQIFDSSSGTYGSPRIAIVLSESETAVSKNTVARRMKVMDLTARPKKKYLVTTDSDHGFKVPGIPHKTGHYVS